MSDWTSHYENEVRRRYPKSALKADYGNSPLAAIKIWCLSSCGGRKDVAACTNFVCPFWRYRPYRDDRVRPDGRVPSQAEIEELVEARSRPGAGAALAAARAARAELPPPAEELDEDDE